jgi:hypothetical protein
MGFGGIWSFIIGAQVACTLLFVPAAVGIFTNSLQDESRWAPFPTERYLTFRLSMDNEALAGEPGAPDDGQIGARRARAYDQLAGRLREEPGVTQVTHGDRLPTMPPEWVSLEMQQDGAAPARLAGNYEGGFAMAAVGAGYHEAFDARIVAGRGLLAADAGASNGPVVVNETFMRVVGRNPLARESERSGRAARSSRDPGTRSSAWSPICGQSRPIGVGRRTSIARPPWRRSILSWSRCASRRTRRRLRPVSPSLREGSMLGCSSGISLHSTTSSHRSKHRRDFGRIIIYSVLAGAVVFSAAGLYALMAVAVARRTRELGIRIALGATPRDVLRSVFARAGRQLGGGIIAGNSLILLIAWRADSLTADLVAMSVITSGHHGGSGRAGVRRACAPGAACSADRGAATGVSEDRRLLGPQRGHRIDTGGPTRGNRAGHQCRERQ